MNCDCSDEQQDTWESAWMVTPFPSSVVTASEEEQRAGRAQCNAQALENLSPQF